jgi:hypothetical protein
MFIEPLWMNCRLFLAACAWADCLFGPDFDPSGMQSAYARWPGMMTYR